MTVKTTKRLCVLSDANVIIEAHALGIWDSLVTQCRMFTTQYIEKNEARYFKSKQRIKSISLKEQIKNGAITILAATHEDTDRLYKTFESQFINSLDPGEIEALALVRAGKVNHARFCTGDGPAITALAMLGRSDLGISFERLLERIGLRSLKSKLSFWYTQGYFKRHIEKGGINFVTGFGLAKPQF